MDRQQTAKILALIQETYPHFMDGRTPEATAEIWARMFPAEEYPQVEAAVLAFIACDTKGFPPSIGQIKEKLAQMGAVDEIDEARAWALVMKAMRNSLYNADKEFAALPPTIQRSVGSPSQLRDWGQMDLEVVNSVVMSNFQRSYRVRASYDREVQKLPESVQRVYKLAGDAFSMDRVFLPASDKPEEPPATKPAEEKPMPESVKSIRDNVQKQVLQDQVEAAHNQTRMMMDQMFGIKMPVNSGGGADGQ